MTTHEKEQRIIEHCQNTPCIECELNDTCEECYGDVTPEIIDRNYNMIFGEDKELTPNGVRESDGLPLIENKKTDRHIEIIKPEDVIPCLLDDDKVIRINLEKMICCDLRDKSIKTIKNDLQKDYYVYLVVDTYDIVNVSNE